MFDAPTTLSPSRIDSFLSCPLAFRFSSIQNLPDPPSRASVLGRHVHRILELFFAHTPADRTPAALRDSVSAATGELTDDTEFQYLAFDSDTRSAFDTEAATLAEAAMAQADPTQIDVVALEKWVEADLGPVTLRGIIDRLERVGDDLVVSDYKTGRAPRAGFEQSALSGVRFYALLCEEALGERPAAVQLLYVRTGDVISVAPTEANRKMMLNRVKAVHTAIARACESGDFPARSSALCSFCAYKPWCPAFDGDPDRAADEAPLRYTGLGRRP